MKFCWKRYALMGVLMTGLAFALGGCGGGGGGGGGSGSDTATFKITGSIAFADGSTSNSTTVNLYKTSYTIYSTATVGGKLYGTRNAAGIESVYFDDKNPLQTATATNGVYTFTGVQSGNYTILPSQQGYLFKSVLIPTLDRIGVLTITENGTVYLYDPEGTGNQLSADGKTIYNTVPFTLAGNVLTNQDFDASRPGGF